MSEAGTVTTAGALLPPLRALLAAYRDASDRVDDLIGALAASDADAVQAAIAAQLAAFEGIARADRRWAAARDDLAGGLRARGVWATAGALTVGAILAHGASWGALDAEDAAALRALRQDLLAALLRLQAANRRAGALLRNAQGVVARVLRAASGGLGGYGSRGQRVVDSRKSIVDSRTHVPNDYRLSTIDSSRRA